MKCLLCNNIIPKERFGIRTHNKYCSEECNKRSWYIRHIGTKKSSLVNNPEFWNTETGIGTKWEIWTSKKLGAVHRKFKTGVDLMLGDKTIDVKSAHIYKRKFKRGKPVKSEQKGYWNFHKENKVEPDFYFCICLLDDKPFKTYMIPYSKMSKTGIIIGWKSNKFDKYLYKV